MAAEPGAPWLPPAVFDGYRLIRPLGAGGMGLVYLGHDLLLDRPVAIKFISRPDGRRRQRFLLEGRALARLVHPNVVLTFRVGRVEERPFLVSEFVDGQSLDRVDKPMPWHRVLELGIRLARGLAAVHAAGILHRDIKPANVVMTPDGEVKLIDFGLAKLTASEQPSGTPRVVAVDRGVTRSPATETDGDSSDDGEPIADAALSRVGAVVGTSRYMSPERLAGHPASVQSDIFALGCVLHELARGWLPSDGPRESGPPVATELQAIFDRCLDADLSRRFSSAEAVLRALETLADDGAVPADLPPGNPYRGLEAFDVEHRALFLGRTAEIRAIVERLRSDPVVVVAGDSGVGKSSLCKAGVLPRLQQEGLFPGKGALVWQFAPGRDPLARLVQALGSTMTEAAVDLRERLLSEPTEILRALGRIAGDRTIVLFVDQIEEIFTLPPADVAAIFAGVLAKLALGGKQFRILATVRSDFLGRLAALPELGPEVARAPYLLRPLDPERLREVIIGPARRTGVSFASSETVTDLMRSALASSGSLPLLQFTLAELWEARDRGSNVIRTDTLTKLGGLEGALERHADRVIGSLSPRQLAIARRLLLRLITQERTRASLTRQDLGELTHDEAATLEALIAGRLIVVRGSDDLAVYELAHEALIVKWPSLRAWLDEDAGQRRTLERLSAAASEWDRLGRRSEALWRGRQLAHVMLVEPAGLAPREREFLLASRANRRRTRLARILVPLGVAAAVALAIVGARLRARAEIDATVSRGLETARRLEVPARQQDDEGARLRQRAFALFDEGLGLGPRGAGEMSWKEAEEIWSQVLDLEAAASSGHARASAALETALLINPARADLRDDLAGLMAVRLAMAVRTRNREHEAELAERLAGLELAGSTASRREATVASLEVRGADRGVALTIAPYVVDSSGRSNPGAVRSLPADASVHALPPGPYLVVATSADRRALRLPVLLERGHREVVQIPPVRSWTAPPGFVLIPAGRALLGTDEEAVRSSLDVAPLHAVGVGSFLIGRFEVTFAEYVEWLESLPPAERTARAPKAVGESGQIELRRSSESGRWNLILRLFDHQYAVAWGERLRYPGRSQRASQDWRRFPVTGVSFEDGVAFAAWLARSGRLPGARVCREVEWERAARGADGRLYTTGLRLLPTDANFDATYGGVDLAAGPDEVGSHPESASPYGVEDLHGNAYEKVASSRWNETAAARGGSWFRGRVQQRLDNRFRHVPSLRDAESGFRLCADAPAP